MDHKRNDRKRVSDRLSNKLTFEPPRDIDQSPGNVKMFPADDLEKLFHLDDVPERIQGSSLNRVLNVDTYEPNAWYVVTPDGVKKL